MNYVLCCTDINLSDSYMSNGLFNKPFCKITEYMYILNLLL